MLDIAKFEKFLSCLNKLSEMIRTLRLTYKATELYGITATRS